MILSAILLRVPSRRRITASEYWPDVPSRSVITSYLDQMEKLVSESSRNRYNPLQVDRFKFFSRECGDDALLIFCTSPQSNDSEVTKQINRTARVLRGALERHGARQLKKEYSSLVDPIVHSKYVVALAGASGVGKTSLLNLLMGRESPSSYEPTIALNTELVESVRFGNCELVILDFAGQGQDRKLWDFSGADVVFLITDSTLLNIVESSRMLNDIESKYPNISLVVIANKQDMKDALDPSAIGKVMQRDVHTMVAIDLAYRSSLFRLIIRILCQQFDIPTPEGPIEEILRFSE